jgi:hypothetical protein
MSDPWDPNDPAVVRVREAERRFYDGLQRPQERRDPDSATPMPQPSKAARVSQLVARIRGGDLSAVDMLRALLARD